MNLEDKLFTLLSENTALMALVSNRISPEITESKTPTPFIVYTRTKSDFVTTLLGEVIDETGEFSIQCCSDDKPEVDDLAKAVIDCFSQNHYTVLDKSSSYDQETNLYLCAVVVLFD